MKVKRTEWQDNYQAHLKLYESNKPYSQSITKSEEDKFDIGHDFLAQGVAGTIWDGFLGKGANDTVDKLNSNIDAAGQLFVQSTNGRWQEPFPSSNKRGPLLYKNVEGDFIAVVKVTQYQTGILYNAGGLMARVANINDAGPGEDLVAVTYFPQFNINNKMDDVNNGSRVEIGPWTSEAYPYLMLERSGDNFYGRVSSDAVTWGLKNSNPINRSDMASWYLLSVTFKNETSIWGTISKSFFMT